MSDYASPEERQQAIREKFRAGFQPGHSYFPPKTEEAKTRQYAQGTPERMAAAKEKSTLEQRIRNLHTPETEAKVAARFSEVTKGMPKVHVGSHPNMESSYKSFAKQIRQITNNGWELVEAVHTMFQEAYAERNFDRTLNAATWLADRGFGKPVQVTALTDAEGNPVAFQLWQPMTHDAADDSQPPVIIDHLARPDIDTSAPPTKVEKQPDIYALGPARIWGQDQDKEQIDE